MSLPVAVEHVLEPLAADPARAALLLDLDGTLAPIVPRPEDSALIDGAREALETLRDRMGLVAFVSGRGLADLERIVAMEGIAYAGNHGMEIHHVGHAVGVAEAVAPWREEIAAFAATDPAELAANGLRMEDKGVTLSIHWRGAPDPDAAERHLHEVMAPRAESRGLRVTWGRMVMEVRPPVAVDKGTAVRELVLHTGCRTAVYVGDDRTDADAWRELRAMREQGLLAYAAGIAAVGAEVPDEVRAAADAEVPGPPGALAVLRWLAGAVAPGA